MWRSKQLQKRKPHYIYATCAMHNLFQTWDHSWTKNPSIPGSTGNFIKHQIFQEVIYNDLHKFRHIFIATRLHIKQIWKQRTIDINKLLSKFQFIIERIPQWKTVYFQDLHIQKSSYSFNQIFIFNTADGFIPFLQFSCRIQKSFLFKKMITFRYNQKRQREREERERDNPSFFLCMKHFFFMRVKGAEARPWSAKCEMVALT